MILTQKWRKWTVKMMKIQLFDISYTAILYVAVGIYVGKIITYMYLYDENFYGYELSSYI